MIGILVSFSAAAACFSEGGGLERRKELDAATKDNVVEDDVVVSDQEANVRDREEEHATSEFSMTYIGLLNAGTSASDIELLLKAEDDAMLPIESTLVSTSSSQTSWSSVLDAHLRTLSNAAKENLTGVPRVAAIVSLVISFMCLAIGVFTITMSMLIRITHHVRQKQQEMLFHRCKGTEYP